MANFLGQPYMGPSGMVHANPEFFKVYFAGAHVSRRCRRRRCRRRRVTSAAARSPQLQLCGTVYMWCGAVQWWRDDDDAAASWEEEGRGMSAGLACVAPRRVAMPLLRMHSLAPSAPLLHSSMRTPDVFVQLAVAMLTLNGRFLGTEVRPRKHK